MEINEDKDLETFLSNSGDPEPEAEEEVEEGSPQEGQEVEEEKEESEDDEGEEVEALTEREKALISQFTESSDSVIDDFDPSVPPRQEWQSQEYTFITEGESIDDILADPAKFNAKMAQLYNDALKKGAEMALEATYKGLPRTISTYAKQQLETTNLVNNFYQENKDLVPLKPALARIAQKIGTEHPEYTLTQLLSESAKTARSVFKLKKTPVAKQQSPAFVGQKGGTNRVTSRNSSTRTLEDEVMELIRQ